MKRFLAQMLAVICVLCLVLGVAGCAKQPANDDVASPTESVTTTYEEETKPEDNTMLPDTEQTSPDAETITPDEESDETDKDTTKSDTNTVKPGKDTAKEDTKLTSAKISAKASLASYAKAEDYRQAEKALLNTAIGKGNTAIDAAADKAGVDAALAAAKKAIDAIPTNAMLTAAEEKAAAEALTSAKAEAKAALDTYAKPEDYRQAQKTQLANAIDNGKSAIDASADKAGVESALAAAKAVIDAIETDAQITAKSPVITSAFDDNTVFTNNRATLDVYVKDANGKKLAASKVTVTVNGKAASVNWDDTVKTSYNFVFEEGENTVVITATDGNYSTTVTYKITCNLQAATTITVSIEAFTVGMGYIVEPYKLVLDETTLTDMARVYDYADAAEMKQKLSAAHCLDYTLKKHGFSMGYQGSLESTWNGFYMSSISGVDTSYIEVPAELQEALETNGFYPEPYVMDEGTLCEFDVTWGSGWMYVMNNSFPNVPFCDYIPQDGDVMRVQFTLAYGSDIGDWGMMGEPFFETVDRDELTALIADAAAAGVDYSEAFAVVSAFGVTQQELDDACAQLRQRIAS